MHRLLCIIPARGGSKRIPQKNIANFYGKPMISYSIKAVQDSGIADEIMVSTDNEEIAEVAKSFGANVPFFRHPETADDKTGLADVLIEVLNEYKNLGKEYEYIACVLATAPLIQARHLKEALDLLLESKVGDSVCPVIRFSYPPQRGLIIKDGYLQMQSPENYSVRSQDLESIYHDCGEFFIFKTGAFLEEKKLYTKNAIPYVLKEMEVQDIDNPEDWIMAELKYKLLRGKD